MAENPYRECDGCRQPIVTACVCVPRTYVQEEVRDAWQEGYEAGQSDAVQLFMRRVAGVINPPEGEHHT